MLDVKAFREERSLTAAQMVQVVREQYPKYDKYMHSKVERPEEYGVRLVNDAERLLEEAFSRTAPNARRKDSRRLPQRIQCRLSKKDYARLQQALKRAGYDTIQAGLAFIISHYLEQTENRSNTSAF